MTMVSPPAGPQGRIGARPEEERPFLSIIIPAYNEEHRLPATLEQILVYLAGQPYTAEILVVENASTDRTAGVVEAFAARFPTVRLLRSRRRGKGGAVRLGMRAARGTFCFLCDTDLSMPIGELAKFLRAAGDGYDIVIGSREVPGARRFGEPPYRHAMGRIYAGVVRLLVLPQYKDTQCGFKLFHRDAAQPLFTRQTIVSWGFDPELLYIARKWGYRVAEVPLDWHYQADSRVRPFRDALQMLRDLLRIRWNDRCGRYDTALRDKADRSRSKPLTGIAVKRNQR